MGVSVITWTEIKAWQEATGNKGLWLASIVRILSRHYVNELILAKDDSRASPLQEHIDKNEQRATVRSQLKAIFGAK